MVRNPTGEQLGLKSARKQYAMDTNFDRSFLQLKYAADDYFDSGENRDETSSGEVNSPMRDLPFNGFTSVVGVGNPPQTFYCIFDTGSSVMFVK